MTNRYIPPHPFSDLWRYVPGGGQTVGVERFARYVLTAVWHRGWHAVFLLRLSQWCVALWLGPIAAVIERMLAFLYCLDIPPTVIIGPGLWMPHPQNIVIHRSVRIGNTVTIFHNVTLGGRGDSGAPIVGDGVCLYVGCSVLGGTTIGDHAKIGAHALVLADVAASTSVVGVYSGRD